MAKTDWGLTDTVRPDDFNDIGREINQLRTDVDHIEVPAASLTEAGIVQLSNAKDSTSESHAATSKALKDVYDLAKSSLTLGNERKQEVVDALIALGVTASTSDSWDSLISKMSAIIKATGNATAADVLAGKTASNVNGPITGTMPNRGAGGTVTPGTTNQTKAAGYYSSPITVLGDADLVPGNIRSGVDLFGVMGTLGLKVNKVSATGSGRGPFTISNIGFAPKMIIVPMYMKNDSTNKTGYSGSFFAFKDTSGLIQIGAGAYYEANFDFLVTMSSNLKNVTFGVDFVEFSIESIGFSVNISTCYVFGL